MFREIKKQLMTIYDESEAHSLALIVMEEIAGLSLTNDLILNCHMTGDVSQAVDRLLNNEPIQYVTGQCLFCDVMFKCDSRALIPRPETEWMVRHLEVPSRISRVLDLGTGTGCIALTIAMLFPEAEVIGVDISDEALALARENASMLEVHNVSFIHDDITSLSIDGMFDIIISNPPYITNAEKKEMRRNVLDWEPHSALFVPDGDELIFHRSIVEFSKKHLSDGGVLAMEINEHLAEPTLSLLDGGELKYDQFGKPRFITKTHLPHHQIYG